MYTSDTERLVKVETRRAIKDHVCHYCTQPISPDQKYARIVLVEEDEDETLKVVKFHSTPEHCGATKRRRRP